MGTKCDGYDGTGPCSDLLGTFESQSSCEAACADRSDCIAYEYDTSSKGCEAFYMGEDGENEVTRTSIEGACASHVCYVKAGPDGPDYFTNDAPCWLSLDGTFSDKAACEAECAGTENCGAFEYYSVDKKCTIFSTYADGTTQVTGIDAAEFSSECADHVCYRRVDRTTLCPSNDGDYVKGDVNADGTINILDIVSVVNYILSHPSAEYNTGQECAADWNYDTTTNILDIVAIVQVILGHRRRQLQLRADATTTPPTLALSLTAGTERNGNPTLTVTAVPSSAVSISGVQLDIGPIPPGAQKAIEKRALYPDARRGEDKELPWTAWPNGESKLCVYNQQCWLTRYNLVTGGTLFQFPGGRAPVGSAGFKNAFDNRKNDHKLYLRIDPPRGVGVPLTIQHTVLDFEATNATWVGIARSLVRGWPTQ